MIVQTNKIKINFIYIQGGINRANIYTCRWWWEKKCINSTSGWLNWNHRNKINIQCIVHLIEISSDSTHTSQLSHSSSSLNWFIKWDEVKLNDEWKSFSMTKNLYVLFSSKSNIAIFFNVLNKLVSLDLVLFIYILKCYQTFVINLNVSYGNLVFLKNILEFTFNCRRSKKKLISNLKNEKCNNSYTVEVHALQMENLNLWDHPNTHTVQLIRNLY